MDLIPPDPLGASPLENWMRRMNRCLRAMRLRSSDTVEVHLVSEGTVLRAKSKGGGVGSAGLVQFWVARVFDDYLSCFDNFARAGTPVSICKAPVLWLSITKETVLGRLMTYTKFDEQTRYATPAGGNLEVHVVNPPWDTTAPSANGGVATPESVVYAMAVQGGVLGFDGTPKLDANNSPITLIEWPGREWGFVSS